MNKSIVSYGEYHEEKNISDITISGPSITIPEGLYREEVNASIETIELATPEISVDGNGKITATINQSAGYVDDDTSSAIHQLAVQAAQTITPGTTDKVIAAAKYLTGVQTIKGDANLLPENIIAGKAIFGVDGTFSLDKMQLCVSISGENTVTATKDGVTVQAFGTSDTFGFMGLTVGTWTITSTNGSYVQTSTVNITDIDELKFLNMFYVSVPVFTYSGSYTILDDSGNKITDPSTYIGNWRIKFTTSGTLNISILNSAANGIDVFMVGGGAGGGSSNGPGGGGGGYTKTQKNISISANKNITVTVGSGGPVSSNGGTSGFNGSTISGGYTTSSRAGGSGGSGGGGGTTSSSHSTGGAGGSNGGNGTARDSNGGTGQGSTTREFGESSGTLYSGGGGGYGGSSSSNASGGAGGSGGGGKGGGYSNGNASSGTNGLGGGGGGGTGGSGGSGIVIIRNKR